MNSLNERTGKHSNTSRSQLLIPIGSNIINANDRAARRADFAATPMPRSQSLQHGSFDPLPSMFGRDRDAKNGPKRFIPAMRETRRDRGSLFKKPLRSQLSGLTAALSPYVTAGVLLALLASSAAFYLGATNPSAYAKTARTVLDISGGRTGRPRAKLGVVKLWPGKAIGKSSAKGSQTRSGPT
jgi:hypothetical protein